MGIYTNGLIYGLRIAKWIDDEANILFEIKDDVAISRKQLREAKLFYEQLTDKHNVLFTTYIECSNTYGEGVYKTWSVITLDVFLEIAGV